MRTRPLGDVTPRELRELLAEESAYWCGELLWDYSEVSSAVASGIERRTLTGLVAIAGGIPVAYCYYILDGSRAIVGSLFAAAAHRGRGVEESLLDAVLAEAQAGVSHDRVECQTLFSTGPGADERFLRAGFASRRRHYLVRSLLAETPAPPPAECQLRTLRREDIPAAAELIFESHRGSLDAALNFTYATPAMCRNFVESLVLRAACGRFDAEASFVAETDDGMAGVLLASHLSRSNGHICQVSVAPGCQARGLGTLLVGSALVTFKRQGLKTASLSVTVDNARAHRLYTRLGFGVRKVFAAHAWARPPARIALPA